MTALAICGGRLVDPAAGMDALKDILLENGRVVEIAGPGKLKNAEGAKVLDASGMVVAPGLIDKYLASAGYKGQLTNEPLAADAPANLFEPVAGNYGAHGRFDSESKRVSWEMFTDRHRTAFWTVAALGLIGGVHLLAKKYKV